MLQPTPPELLRTCQGKYMGWNKGGLHVADQQALSHSNHQGSVLIHSAEETAGRVVLIITWNRLHLRRSSISYHICQGPILFHESFLGSSPDCSMQPLAQDIGCLQPPFNCRFLLNDSCFTLEQSVWAISFTYTNWQDEQQLVHLI